MFTLASSDNQFRASKVNARMNSLSTQAVCEKVIIKPKKVIRKLPRIQHLFARLTGRLRSEEDEVTKEARTFQSLRMK